MAHDWYSVSRGGPAGCDGNLIALPSGRMAVFPVQANGRLGEPVVTPFSAMRGQEGLSASFLPTPGRWWSSMPIDRGIGTIASYTINPDNRLSLLGDPLPVGGFAACWIVRSGRYVYTASFGAPSGVREILGEGPGLPDLNGEIHGFRLRQNGTLKALAGVDVAIP